MFFSLRPKKVPPLTDFWKILTHKWSNYDVKSVISCQIMILNPDFVVRITSYVKTLILDHFHPSMRFTSRDHLTFIKGVGGGKILSLLFPSFLHML